MTFQQSAGSGGRDPVDEVADGRRFGLRAHHRYTVSMIPRPSRRLLLGLLALPILLLLGDYVVWRSGEAVLRARYAQWVAAERTAGWTITSGPVSAGGWPLAVSLSVPDLALSVDDSQMAGRVSWRTERLILSVALLHPQELLLTAQGQQRVQIGALPDLPFVAARLVAKTPLADSSQPPPANVVAEQVRIDVPVSAGGGNVTIAKFDLGLTHASDADLAVALQAADITLPVGPRARWPVGPRVAELAVDAVITGPLPAMVPLVPRLSVWRDGGGKLIMHRFGLRWGPLDVSASATLSLDAQLQPAGDANAKITGLAAALDAMAETGAIKPQAALAAKAVLALIGTPASADAPAGVDIPLTLRDRTLAMGRIPLVRLPQITWPGPADTGMVAQ